MGKAKKRFVGKSEAEQGWRIWDNKIRRWWGERYMHYPEQLLAELNGEKRPGRLAELIRTAGRQRFRRSA
jgi:hypothetical protein